MLRLITKLLRLHPKPQAEPDDSAIYVPEANAPMATVLGSEDGKVKAGAASVAWDNITGIPSGGMPPALHAPTHQHGGDDEVATGIPSAFAIPKAGEDGKLAEGWLPDSAYENIYNTDGTLTGHRTVTCDRKFFVIVDAFLWGVSLPTASDGSYVLISNPDLPATDYWQIGTKDDEHMIQGYIGGLLLQATTTLFVKSPAVIASTAVAGQVPTLVNATTGETEFADAPATDPAGSDREIQFNDGGVFGASSLATLLDVATPSWMDADLSAYWNCNESSGNVLDASGNGRDLTEAGTLASVAGILNTARLGTSSTANYAYRNSEAALQGGDRDYSLVFWFKYTAVAGYQSIISKLGVGGGNFEWTIYTDAADGNQIHARVYKAVDSAVDLDTGFTPTAGVWYFGALRIDATNKTLNLRINTTDYQTSWVGNLQAAGTGRFQFFSQNIAGGEIPMNGALDEVLFSARYLTDGELDELYGGGTPPGLTAAYFKQVLQAKTAQTDYSLEVKNGAGTTLHGIKPVAPVTYTTNNATTDRSFDCNSTSLDEVADALATLIDDLNNRFGGFK